MSECKHGLEKSWCVVCKGSVVLVVRDPTVAMCCAPKCDKASGKQVASLPLCEPHFNRLESHVAKVHQPFDWEKYHRENKKPPPGNDWVYFIRLGEVIKIGHSRQIFTRLRSFASYGQEVHVLGLELGGRDLEIKLHRRFADTRSTVGFSKELFEPSEELDLYILTGRKCAICEERATPNRVTCAEHNAITHFEPEESLIGVQLHAARDSA